ncbi:MAG: type II toxin-antitoxin system RelE/ParE family toxin [Coriobacteriia bacterium]|nr:type II toxin-antitoxin system RelE/ParE family toxin [Coriobacteriia bacterium]MCL2749442.1 type II toxin-antitoxin system RelE/ParE family toxin [Coriobacteriia bacterium]
MTYRLRYSKRASKQLDKIDARQSRIIALWLLNNIDGCDDPRALGSSLSAEHKGKWRYRVGKYRILVEIRDEELIVLALEIGHRRDVYRKL